MASLSKSKSGAWSVQWYAPCPGGGKPSRETLYLGKCTKATAQDFERHIDKLMQAQRYEEQLPAITRNWLANLPLDLREKLAKKGVTLGLPKRTQETPTIGTLCDGVLDHLRLQVKKGDRSPATLKNYELVADRLKSYFTADRLLRDPTLLDDDGLPTELNGGDVDDFRDWLLCSGDADGGPLAEPTVGSRCKTAKKFFARAVRKKWIRINPFDGMRGLASKSADRDHFVEADVFPRLMEATADPQLRAFLAVVRYQGCRVMSDIRELRWEWVHWGDAKHPGQMTILNWKNRRHAGKKWKTPPLFPETREALSDWFEACPDGAEWIFPDIREITAAAVRNRVERLLLRTGIAAWPNFWNNVRATRYTELTDEFAEHLVVKWLGHSKRVARKHYGRVSKEHLQRAADFRTAPQPSSGEDSAISQNAEPTRG